MTGERPSVLAPDGLTYSRCLTLSESPTATRSSVVFVHGFPDSPEMFAAYHTAEERAQRWLRNRNLYAFEFPNRLTGPGCVPPLRVMVRGFVQDHGSLQAEVDQVLDGLAARSPTGKLLLVAHDWGATSSWSWVRRRPHAPVEKFVSLSVGSSFRYDVWEHGPVALSWLYSAVLCLGYLFPVRWVHALLARWTCLAGYRHPRSATLALDCWHYWYGPFTLLAAPFSLLGLRYRPGFVGFDFPVLYLRSKGDAIASTKAFERHLEEREDCVIEVWPEVNHWFPEQDPERVLKKIRTFV